MERKFLSLEQAADAVRASRADVRAVVMCHGCFDIVHPGHVRHLQQAARHGDRLLVTITGDGAMRKGDGRPLIPQELRAENLGALDCVDWVAVSPGPTALEALEIVRPDVYMKGREYEHNLDPRFAAERELADRLGIRVVLSSGDVVFSSTALIAAMEETAEPVLARLRALAQQHGLTPDGMEATIGAFRGRRVVVVGEVIVDTYVLCDRPEMSGESPMMTLRPLESRSFAGGAAIVAAHLAAMGARPTLVTALPPGATAARLRDALADGGVEVRAIDAELPVVEKTRYLVGTSKVVKIDRGLPTTLDARAQRGLARLARESAGGSDAVVVTDYGQSLFTATSLRELCDAVRDRTPVLAGDVSGRRSNLLSLRGVDLLCPSEAELRGALHEYDAGLTSVTWDVLDRTGARAAIVTLGDEGLIAFARRPDAGERVEDWRSRLSAEHVPSLARHAVDQLGCGDALLAAATLALASGASLVEASVLGSIAAAEEAGQLGNVAIGAPELRRGARRIADARLTYAARRGVAIEVPPGPPGRAAAGRQGAL